MKLARAVPANAGSRVGHLYAAATAHTRDATHTQGAAFEGEQALVEIAQRWTLQRLPLPQRQPIARQEGMIGVWCA